MATTEFQQEDALLEYDLRIWRKELEDALENRLSDWPSKANGALTVAVLDDAISMVGTALNGGPLCAKQMIKNGYIKSLYDLHEDVNWGYPKSESTEIPEKGLGSLPIRELLEDENADISWVLDGALLEGGSSLIASDPKSGKSTLSRCLALAVASGQDFLGRRTNQGFVILIAIDEPRSLPRAHFKELGLTGDELINIITTPLVSYTAKKLKEEIEIHNPILIIVDTLEKFLRPTDGNKYSEVVKMLGEVTACAAEHSVHVAFIHHENKSGEGINKIMGSAGYGGGVDTTFSLQKKGNVRRLTTTGSRAGEDFNFVKLIKGNDGWVRADEEQIIDVNEETEIQDTIINYLKGRDASPQQEILEAVGFEKMKVIAALNALVDSGVLAKKGRGRKGDPFQYSFLEKE